MSYPICEPWTYDIAAELVRQYNRFGDQIGMSDLRWMAILGEEFGEVCRAVLEGQINDTTHLRKKLVHTAALCANWIECLDRRSKA